jgi:hypothetical protein
MVYNCTPQGGLSSQWQGSPHLDAATERGCPDRCWQEGDTAWRRILRVRGCAACPAAVQPVDVICGPRGGGVVRWVGNGTHCM